MMTCKHLLRDSLSLLICWLMGLIVTDCLLTCSAADSFKDEVKCIVIDVIPVEDCFVECHVCDQEALLSKW